MKNLFPILSIISVDAPTFCSRNYANKLITRIKSGEMNVHCGETFVRNFAKEEPVLMERILGGFGMSEL